MPKTIDEIREHLHKRIREYAEYVLLELILTQDVETRRRIEKNYERVGEIKESVRVELERERVQMSEREIWENIDGVIDLLIKAAKNE